MIKVRKKAIRNVYINNDDDFTCFNYVKIKNIVTIYKQAFNFH